MVGRDSRLNQQGEVLVLYLLLVFGVLEGVLLFFEFLLERVHLVGEALANLVQLLLGGGADVQLELFERFVELFVAD